MVVAVVVVVVVERGVEKSVKKWKLRKNDQWKCVIGVEEWWNC